MYHIAICKDEPPTAKEHEAALCRVLNARRLQREADYTIVRFSAPGPLFASLQEDPSAFQLLLLDIGLARESGLELALRLREWDVDCSIIYVTSLVVRHRPLSSS